MKFLERDRESLADNLRAILRPVPSSVGHSFDREGHFRGDHDLNPASFPPKNVNFKPAAVLVPIVMRDETPSVLLTKRATHLNKHAGQISFPGGRAEDLDKTAVNTALRESDEEIGLKSHLVEIVGSLNTYVTVTNYSVTPIVGLVDPDFDLVADANEVAEIFEVPLQFLLDSKNHQKHSGFHNGIERFWYAMPYNDYYIWGATAGMIKDLAERIPQR